jgi:hypothetical protein
MIKKILGTMAITGGLIGLAGCHHHHGRHCWGPTPEEKAQWIVKKAGKKLDLDETQKSALKDVADALLAIRAEMHQEKDKTHNEVLAMINSEKLDTGRLLEIVATKQRLVDENAPSILEKLALFHGTLNEEQKDKITAHFKKYHTECD